MCGRYALALRPSQIRRMLQDNDMPVWDAPEDEGDGAPRQSYNFAPGYHGVVYRADVPDWGAGPQRSHKTGSDKSGDKEQATSEAQEDENTETEAPEGQHPGEQQQHYKLQSMKWGLVPFWTKRNPDYASVLKTINCRDDSLATSGGLWATMKARKRCVVVAQGFYEWLKTGPKEKVPHYIKRRDGGLMCFAGLWDVVQYEGDGADGAARKNYTYTIITTDSNKQLKFLHDRMPVILDPGSEAVRTWLDPGRYEWSKELQGLLRPFEGELEVYPVSKEVGKVGNNSPQFIVPVASRENKSNIANFFANAAAKGASSPGKKTAGKGKVAPEVEVKQVEGLGDDGGKTTIKTESLEDAVQAADDGGMLSAKATRGVKREAEENDRTPLGEPPAKRVAVQGGSSPTKKPGPAASSRAKISATSNGTSNKSPSKASTAGAGTQKITKFFANSS